MTTATSVLPQRWAIANLRAHLGHIPLRWIRLYPPLGRATLEDVLTVQAREDRLCELIDGVLVEKTVSYCESRLALLLGSTARGLVPGAHCDVLAVKVDQKGS